MTGKELIFSAISNADLSRKNEPRTSSHRNPSTYRVNKPVYYCNLNHSTRSPMSVIHLVVRHFTDISAIEESRLLALLTIDDQDNIARHPLTRRNQQLARAWRRDILAQALSTAPAALRFANESHGKPYLANDVAKHQVSFNLSHSANAFAMAWSLDHISLGVDIEDQGTKRKQHALAARTFHYAEMMAWQNPALSATQANAQWLKTWTRKESVLKAHGLGIRMDLNTLNTENDDDTARHTLIGDWQYQSFVWDKEVVSVAWQSEKDTQIVMT
jgi:4'-phosphopantetheinyl transferase